MNSTHFNVDWCWSKTILKLTFYYYYLYIQYLYICINDVVHFYKSTTISIKTDKSCYITMKSYSIMLTKHTV